jgi:C4-dicarboxylate transporter DctM subunit
MDPMIIGLIAIVAFLILISQGVPIAFSFAIVGFLGILVVRGPAPALIALGSMPYTWSVDRMLVPVPLFILMGYFAFVAGITKDLYDAASKWFGRLPGGIAMATTAACTGFAACCGAVPAAAATMSTIAYPEMQKYHYDKKLSTGCISAGSTVSILIPPSIPFILYGMLSETSVADLFVAGIIPGIMMAGFFLLLIYIMCRRNPAIGPAGPSFSWREKFASLKGTIAMIVLFLLVIGGLYTGIFTTTEAGAIGAFGAFAIALIMRRLTFSRMITAAKETGKLTAFVALLIIGAQIFNLFLGVAGFQARFTEWITTLTLSPWVIMVAVIAVYIVLGMFLDIMAIILLTVPTLAPVIGYLGFDLVWFGVIVVLLAQIGFLTPPIGMCSYIVHGTTKVPLEDVFRGVMPFSIVMIALILILLVFPQIALFLPNLLS